MSNDEQFKFVPFGIFGSIIVGIGMLIAGTVNDIGALVIIGVVVLVGGIVITITCTVVLAIRKYSRDMSFRTEKKPSDAELIERITSGAHDYVSELVSREDELTELFHKHGRKDLEDSYCAEAEPIWDNYRGADWDENLDAIDSLIDKYYERFYAENGENSQKALDEIKKTADFEQKQDRSPVAAQADREKSERDIEPEKIEKISVTEEQIKTENTAVENANATTDELDRADGRSPKKAAVGYRPMKKK